MSDVIMRVYSVSLTGAAGSWLVTCQTWPGITAHGVSPEVALENMRRAIQAQMNVLKASNGTIPDSDLRGSPAVKCFWPNNVAP